MRDSVEMQGAELSLAPIIYVFDLHGSALRAFLGHEHIIDCFDLEGANAVRLRNGAWGLVAPHPQSWSAGGSGDQSTAVAFHREGSQRASRRCGEHLSRQHLPRRPRQQADQ